ncbi:hypothetical protein HYQ46_006653 [Verticillium longisporum]|nr:hypothetical protein HYQ46_006653 [Verticillium longisporum]
MIGVVQAQATPCLLELLRASPSAPTRAMSARLSPGGALLRSSRLFSADRHIAIPDASIHHDTRELEEPRRLGLEA